MGAQKYIFVNGIMQTNPEWQAQQSAQGNKPSAPPMCLAVVSNMEDAAEAGAAQVEQTGVPMQMPQATQDAMTNIQGDAYEQKLQAPNAFQPGEVLEKLTSYFARYEVPLGLVNKLHMLSEYSLNLIVDDSGSMNNTTDSNTTQTGDYMKKKFPMGHAVRALTRWEEAEDRVHTIIDLITYVPTGPLTVRFMNRPVTKTFDRRGKAPEQFAAEAHQGVVECFRDIPRGQTPTKKVLLDALNLSPPNTMHYLFTDGQPSDTSAMVATDDEGEQYNRYPEIEQIVTHRRNPRAHPITFVSCTGDDDEVKWMKVLEEAAPYAAEIDDFADEAREVHHDQGPYFPFTKGFWLICLLAAAINPDDLDAMDESAPFSKMTLDNLLGRVTTEQDYVHYFRSHPQEPAVRAYYQEFLTAQATGKQIWLRHGLRPGPRNVVPAQPQAQPHGYGGQPQMPQSYPSQGYGGAAGGRPPAQAPAAGGYGAPPPPQNYASGSYPSGPPSAPQGYPAQPAAGGYPGARPPQGYAGGYPPQQQQEMFYANQQHGRRQKKKDDCVVM